jgi:DNA-binding protein HU-beta
MNKAELIDAIAQEASLKRADAKKLVDAFVKVTSESLAKGDKLVLLGFGTFSIIERGARVGRNPITGASLNVPAKKIVKFKPGAELRGKVN